MARVLQWLSTVCLCAGCAHAPTGTLGPDYFKHNESGYEVLYLGDGPAEGLGAGWSLDNYKQAPGRGGKLAYFVREGEGYGFDRRYDFDGDGLPDHHVRRATYDLRYTQDGGEGVIWTRSVILAEPLEGKALSALAERYLLKVPRVGPVFPHFGEGLPAGVADAHYQVEDVERSGDCEVANVPAYRVDFSLRGSGEAKRVSLVLMRPGYRHSIVANGQTHTYEVLVIAAHANSPEGFDASAPTFDALLDHMSLARGQRAHSCRPGGAPAPSSGSESSASSAALPPAAPAQEAAPAQAAGQE